jgi:hypothetical protein
MAPSLVWKYFNKKKDDKGLLIANMTVCKLCSNEVKQQDGNTSTLMKHLKHNHILKHAELETEQKSVKRKADTTASELNSALAYIQAQQPESSSQNQALPTSSSKKRKPNPPSTFFTKIFEKNLGR